jgi:hypothetical protein
MPTKTQDSTHPIGAFPRKNKRLPNRAKSRKRLDFYFFYKNVLHLSFSKHRILALFTHMKNPSLIAAPGIASSGTLADQISPKRSIGESMDPVRRHRAGLPGNLVQLLRQSTPATNNTPGS